MPAWESEVPTNYWSRSIQQYFQTHATFLLRELQSHQLRICLAQSKDSQFEGQMRRVKEGENPIWYKALCASNPHWRRKRTVRALTRLSGSKDRAVVDQQGCVRGAYSNDAIMRDVIYSHLTSGGKSAEFGNMPAYNAVREYFGLERLVGDPSEVIEEQEGSDTFYDDELDPIPF